jgi:hypothetical protein
MKEIYSFENSKLFKKIATRRKEVHLSALWDSLNIDADHSFEGDESELEISTNELKAPNG